MIRMRRVGWRILCLAGMLVFLQACNNIDNALDDLLGALPPEQFLDQGYVYFDDTGNIMVVMNNTEFATNPIYNPASIIMAWVFRRGANVNSRCCTGSGCPVEQSNACMIGVGFSHDLAFTGSQYLDIHPPQAFDRLTSRYYMPIFVADAEGVPQNFQGEYQDFSSPVNIVGDREQFDLYIGIYYSAYSPLFNEPRVYNIEAPLGQQTLYTGIAPDLISPAIQIESRFFPQSSEDPSGSWYTVPPILQWSPGNQADQGVRFRNRIRINEIGNALGGQTNNDFIELYNPTSFTVPLLNVYLQRWSGASTACTELSGANEKMNLSAFSIPPFGTLSIARAGTTLSVDATFTGSVIIGDSDCFALTFGNDQLFQGLADTSLIDFVGLSGASGGGQSEGGNPASALVVGNAISRCPDGNDSNNNGIDFTLRTPTVGTANACTPPPDQTPLLINEWADAGANVDYIEIKNSGASAVTVDTNLRVVFGTGAGTSATLTAYLPDGVNDPGTGSLSLSSGVSIAPGELFLIVDSDVAVGDITTLRGFNGFTGKIFLSTESTLIGTGDRLSDNQAYLSNGLVNWSQTPSPFTVGTSTYSALKASFVVGTDSTLTNGNWCNGTAGAMRSAGVDNGGVCP